LLENKQAAGNGIIRDAVADAELHWLSCEIRPSGRNASYNFCIAQMQDKKISCAF
jgi:hypothetical protein